jgi:Zn-dependent peptidase ImmA (M78 family)
MQRLGVLSVVATRLDIVKGFAYKGRKGYLIAVNTALDDDARLKVYLHELRHIWDMYHKAESTEKTADAFASEILAGIDGFCM